AATRTSSQPRGVEPAPRRLRGPGFSETHKRGHAAEALAPAAVLRRMPYSPAGRRIALLELDRPTRPDHLLLHLLPIRLGAAFLDDLGRRLDEILRLFETEARDLADRLDDGDLVAARVREVNVELGLLLDRSRSGGRSATAAAATGNDCGRSLYAPLVL